MAIALRNRIRRQKLAPEMAEEVMPKNILMIGPTGVGKTEIARRLARLAKSPFLKVEASKFTEVGYVGRDVESMIRDLVEISIDMVREERLEEVAERAERNAEERLLDLLLPPQPEASESAERTREKLREQLRAGKLDDRHRRNRRPRSRPVVRDQHQRRHRGDGRQSQGHAAGPVRPAHPQAQDARRRSRRVPGSGRRAEADRHGQVTRIALERVERAASSSSTRSTRSPGREGGHGPDVSREGVQRDILPIVEGTTVNTRYGMVRTDHILFIAAGAFHVSKPSDLIPELQGRFPIRVELKSLTEADFVRILTEPKNALVKQYMALLETEGIKLTFTDDAVEEISALRRASESSAPRTSARAACTPSWRSCSTRFPSTGPISRRRTCGSTRPMCASNWPTSSRIRI